MANTISRVDESQRRGARVVGLAYLFALAPAIFAEFYVRGQLMVSNNAAETARTIVAHERLFRLGIASNLLVVAIDVVLITALYVVLERVNRHLALLAAFFRLLETAMLVVVTLSDFDVLRVLSGADYLRAFEADRLQALARLSLAAHRTGARAFAFIVVPDVARVVTIGYYGGPVIFFELTMGLWLLFKGLRPSAIAER
jgi:hypothetical protein